MDRIFGTLELRAVDDERREFEGIANTAALDDHGTIIEPEGARFTLPLPLLWQHDQHTPVGEITEARLVNGQWRVRGAIRRIEEAGPFKEATDRAWQGVKHRLVRGLSIGFKPLKQKANRFLEWAWRELSLVTIPSNQEATIELVRSSFAASGDLTSPGVPGNPTNRNAIPTRGNMTILEQIQQHENSRAAKVAAKTALIERSAAEGRTLDESESEEFDTLDNEIRSIDGHLTRLNSLKRDNEARATPVVATSQATASASRGGETEVRGGVPVVRVQTREDSGIGFARYAMALLSCNGNRYEAAEYAKRTWGDSAEPTVNLLRNPELMQRAAVPAGTTTGADWAKPLVNTTPLNDFLELLRARTLLGRIPGLRYVPFNISMPSQTAGGTYYWVGEGASTPVTKPAYGSVALGFAKAGGIIALTEDLVRSSAPSAQEAVRDEMIAGMQAFLDGQFITPTVAPVANVSPGAITNGIPAGDTRAATGTTEAAARADLRWLLGGFAGGNFDLGGVALMMSEGMAFTLGTVVNAVGEPAFPGINVGGGNVLGLPVVTSNILGTTIAAVHAPSILIADEGGTELDVSREASIIMDNTPDTVVQAAGAAPIHTSLWQKNMVGLRALRTINWGRARTGAVRTITAAAYA